ncbi:MAG TPA: fumarylacetoacetate hydrolase family protein [Steroidobacteraceae bacterium]
MQFKLGTFSVAGAASFAGLVLERVAGTDSAAERVVPLTLAEPLLERLNLRLRQSVGSASLGESLLSLLTAWDSNFQALAILCESFPGELLQRSVPLDELRVRAPIDPPRQVFCTIANYRSHIIETIVDAGVPPHTDAMDAAARRQYAERSIEERLRGAPYACFKLPSTIIGPTDALQIPRHAQRVDWELELGVVIGKAARRVSRSEAMSYVAGYVLVNDITARDQVRRTDVPNMGTDWLQSKNAPGFLPLGPYFVPAAFLPDPYSLRLALSLNDRLMQDGSVSEMLFDIATQVEYISQHAQLLPGDVICTGTPAGCGTHHGRYLQPGDVIHASAGELGAQHTPCIAES